MPLFDFNCPHCKKGIHIGVDVGEVTPDLYSEDTHTVDCPHCKKEILVTSQAKWTFEAEVPEDV